MQRFKKVIIIDDDKVFHFIFKKLLLKKNEEMVLSFFENGYDAIDELKGKMDSAADLPDLILLDINMPIIDGWQFLEEFKLFKNQLKKIPEIYLISSSDDIVDLNKSKIYKDEIMKYLIKPMILENMDNLFN